jgi:hypothetical protein
MSVDEDERKTLRTGTSGVRKPRRCSEISRPCAGGFFPVLALRCTSPTTNTRPSPRTRTCAPPIARERAGIVLALAPELATLHRSHDPSLGPSPRLPLILLASPLAQPSRAPHAPHAPASSATHTASHLLFSPFALPLSSLGESWVLPRHSSAQPICVPLPSTQQLHIGTDTRHPHHLFALTPVLRARPLRASRRRQTAEGRVTLASLAGDSCGARITRIARATQRWRQRGG